MDAHGYLNTQGLSIENSEIIKGSYFLIFLRSVMSLTLVVGDGFCFTLLWIPTSPKYYLLINKAWLLAPFGIPFGSLADPPRRRRIRPSSFPLKRQKMQRRRQKQHHRSLEKDQVILKSWYRYENNLIIGEIATHAQLKNPFSSNASL